MSDCDKKGGCPVTGSTQKYHGVESCGDRGKNVKPASKVRTSKSDKKHESQPDS